jgi:hypothetical protein
MTTPSCRFSSSASGRSGLLQHVCRAGLVAAATLLPAQAWGAPPTEETIFGPATFVRATNAAELPHIIAWDNEHGGTIILEADAPRGPMPVRPTQNTRIVDLRYNGGIDIVRGNHPRLQGIWPQYSGLGTGLGKNFVISDVLPYDMKVETWEGVAIPPNPVDTNRHQDSHEYSNTHNHYQNLLSEVWNFSPTVNGVALWGDSGAFFPGAKSWGGFLSARSWPVHWDKYVPEGTPGFEDKDFDAQLVGLEVDVLNAGLPDGRISPTVGHGLSKTGVQIVGFGSTNSNGIELRSEDSEDLAMDPDKRRGTWHYGIIAFNSLNSDSIFIASKTPVGRTGLDFGSTRYADSAIKLHTDSPKTGISFNEYEAGQIYGLDGRLVLQAGKGGLRIVSNDPAKAIVTTDSEGALHLNGNVYVNDRPLSDAMISVGPRWLSLSGLLIATVVLLLIVSAVNVALVLHIVRRRTPSSAA